MMSIFFKAHCQDNYSLIISVAEGEQGKKLHKEFDENFHIKSSCTLILGNLNVKVDIGKGGKKKWIEK